MSQEARLKLRMQKELKLLLADPPHGTSFPFLSSNSDIIDLCSIDAQIEGPEETVYSKGIFKIKIQIPERYPLQPPIVTFATPIYHPNIDTGGRICLDILNLPPKGAWQPSLNISTVLTSIRLLLGEPNPDDGLMCEASREYKYNRQAFDLKARSMTEKFAKAGVGESSCNNQCTETKADSAMVEVQGSDQESNHGAQEFNPSHKRSLSISQKLSLESSSSNKKTDADQKVPNDSLFLPGSVTQMDSKRKRETENDLLNEYNLNNEKVNGKGKKLSLKTFDQCKDDFDNKENADPNYLSSLCQRPASYGSSLDFTSSNKKKDAEQKVPDNNLCLSITQMESKRKREEENDMVNEYNLNNENVNGKGKGKKLFLKTSDQCKEDFGNKEIVDPNYLSSLCQHPASSRSSPSPASRNQQLDQQENGNSEKSSSKLCQRQKQSHGTIEAMQTCENVKDLGVNLFIPASVIQMKSKRKREKENDVLIEYNLNSEKVGKGRKSSSKLSDRFKDDFDNKENVDPNYLSPLCRNQQLDQHEDGNSANSNTKSSSKLYQSLKQPFGSMESMQTCENVEVLGTVEKSYVDRIENIPANKKTVKISSVGKKLSLGLKGSSHRQKVSNKENVMPIHKLPLSKPQTPGKSVLGRKPSLVPSTQQLQQDCGPNQKQQSNQVIQSKQTDVEVKQKGKTEMEEESSISENVVVLDSEESEGEEQTAPLRMRMPLAARKRLGKWRV